MKSSRDRGWGLGYIEVLFKRGRAKTLFYLYSFLPNIKAGWVPTREEWARSKMQLALSERKTCWVMYNPTIDSPYGLQKAFKHAGCSPTDMKNIKFFSDRPGDGEVFVFDLFVQDMIVPYPVVRILPESYYREDMN